MSKGKVRFILLTFLVISFLFSMAIMLYVQDNDVVEAQCVYAPAIVLHGEIAVERNNQLGYSWTSLGAYDTRRFCFLSSVQLEDVDDYEERAGCSVEVKDGIWVLFAYITGKSTYARAQCKAQCITW